MRIVTLTPRCTPARRNSPQDLHTGIQPSNVSSQSQGTKTGPKSGGEG